MKNGIILLPEDMQAVMAFMTLEQLGLLFTALCSYACGKKPPEMEPLVGLGFETLKSRSQRNRDELENPNNQSKPDETRIDSRHNHNAAPKPGKKVTGDADALFTKLWAQYPNKKGKGKISDAKKRSLLEIGEEHMLRAIRRYINEHNAKEKRGEFVPCWQNGSTFFNSGYVDYLDENYTAAPHEPRRSETPRSAFFCYEQSNTDWDEVFFQAMLLQEKEEEQMVAESSKTQKNAL